MASSSSPPPRFRPSTSRAFQLTHLAIPPSSPTAAYKDGGELSPSFDSSFASSMSITADVHERSPLGQQSHAAFPSSSPHLMDISPAPSLAKPALAYVPQRRSTLAPAPTLERSHTMPLPTASHPSSNNYPFLKNLFQSRAPRSQSPNQLPAAPVARPALHQVPLQHYATLPLPKTLSQLEASSRRTSSAGKAGAGSSDAEEGRMSPPPVPSQRLPSLHATQTKHHTAPIISLHPPAVPAMRFSDSAIPTIAALIDSSPVRMDLDTSFGSPFSTRPENHPRSLSDSNLPSPSKPLIDDDECYEPDSVHLSGASDRLADLFGDDLSPIRPSRKRFLASDVENSPTPKSLSPPAPSAIPLLPFVRRSFEKASSISSMSSVSRRRTSGSLPFPTTKSLVKRPSLASVRGTAMEQALAKVTDEDEFIAASNKRHAQAAQNGKPMPKIMRRAFSVADAFALKPLTNRDVNIIDSMVGTSYRASTNTDGYFAANAGAGARLFSAKSIDIGMLDGNAKRPAERGSPLTGFRTQEEKGKALPCFGVKEDGLMRITSDTLNHLVAGAFSDSVARYLIIDCRFSYEYEGGHIATAVNLPTTAEVERALLNLSRVPAPSTSESPPSDGKTVLVFHCEFSAKRAPSSAKHLRSKDRLLNIGCYPSVHYPEVYILQGGYADFWKSFPNNCEGPVGYVSMDDPDHLAKRSVDLNAFRQQKRQFNRAKSFTFGESANAGALLSTTNYAKIRPSLSRQGSGSTLAPGAFIFPKGRAVDGAAGAPGATTPGGSKSGMTITEEGEHEGDSSFGASSGSSPGGGGGDSPCPSSKTGRIVTLKIGPSARRPMERAQTSNVLMFGR